MRVKNKQQRGCAATVLKKDLRILKMLDVVGMRPTRRMRPAYCKKNQIETWHVFSHCKLSQRVSTPSICFVSMSVPQSKQQ